MKHRGALVAILAVLVVGLAACGSSNSSTSTTSNSAPAAAAGTSTASNTKAKFVLHAGLAFGAFHHWIYKPAKAGELSHPSQHKFTTIKAALAALFVYHELGLALKNAQADATLSKLVAPITALQTKIKSVAGSVKSGGTSAADAGNLNDAISSIKQAAAGSGATIAEKVPATPSG